MTSGNLLPKYVLDVRTPFTKVTYILTSLHSLYGAISQNCLKHCSLHFVPNKIQYTSLTLHIFFSVNTIILPSLPLLSFSPSHFQSQISHPLTWSGHRGTRPRNSHDMLTLPSIWVPATPRLQLLPCSPNNDFPAPPCLVRCHHAFRPQPSPQQKSR